MDPIRLHDSLASWCLDHLPADPPRLIGVELGPRYASLHCIDLRPGDPLADLDTLTAPAEWHLAIVLCASSGPTAEQIRVAHVAARDGGSFTVLRSQGSAPASIRNGFGRIATASAALFAVPGGEQPRSGAAIRRGVSTGS